MTTAQAATLVERAAAVAPDARARIERGLALWLAGGVRRLGPDLWAVRGSGNVTYVVASYPRWACGCPDHTARQRACKHVYAAWLAARLGGDDPPPAPPAAAVDPDTRVTLTEKGRAVAERIARRRALQTRHCPPQPS